MNFRILHTSLFITAVWLKHRLCKIICQRNIFNIIDVLNEQTSLLEWKSRHQYLHNWSFSLKWMYLFWFSYPILFILGQSEVVYLCINIDWVRFYQRGMERKKERKFVVFSMVDLVRINEWKKWCLICSVHLFCFH